MREASTSRRSNVPASAQCRSSKRSTVGTLEGDGLDETTGGEEEHLAIRDLVVAPESDEQREVRQQLSGTVAESERLDRDVELLASRHDVIAREDAGELLHLLREGTVERLLAVWQRAPAEHACAALFEFTGELGRETRLADPRLTEHRHEVRALFGDDAFEDAL